ncbi:MAG: hypothetical protein PHN57_04745 [Candidatus Omnitrophica bacterium]|nr:hypothetical protein [Candidatus Omnitrophota bacterium]
MDSEAERELGEQPIAAIMAERGLKASDLVSNSTEQLTFKMVGKAVKGRRLTPKAQGKVLRALNKAAGREYSLKELFNYSSR